MSGEITKRKSRPEIQTAIDKLVQKHAAYYQGWLTRHVESQSKVSIERPPATRQENVMPARVGSRLKQERPKG